MHIVSDGKAENGRNVTQTQAIYLKGYTEGTSRAPTHTSQAPTKGILYFIQMNSLLLSKEELISRDRDS